MNTCTYCNCEVLLIDAVPETFDRHRDIFLCMAALRHENVFLKSELGAERSLFADTISTHQSKIETLKRHVAELELELRSANADWAYLNDRLEICRECPTPFQTSED